MPKELDLLAAALSSEAVPRLEPPDHTQFVDPFNDRALRDYYRDLRAHFGYIKFLALLAPDNRVRDVPLNDLFVHPNLSKDHLTPEQLDASISERDKEQKPRLAPAGNEIIEHQRLLVLGDPGSGKSTLVSWICDSLADPDGKSSKGVVGIADFSPSITIVSDTCWVPDATAAMEAADTMEVMKWTRMILHLILLTVTPHG